MIDANNLNNTECTQTHVRRHMWSILHVKKITRVFDTIGVSNSVQKTGCGLLLRSRVLLYTDIAGGCGRKADARLSTWKLPSADHNAMEHERTDEDNGKLRLPMNVTLDSSMYRNLPHMSTNSHCRLQIIANNS